jgi:DnaJ-class molecular chaperone
VRLILIGLGLVVGWLLFVLAKPQARCWRCLGKRVRKGGNGKRKVKCKTCRGHGVARLPGATMAHRFFWSVMGDRLNDRRREEIAAQLAARKDET